MTASLFDTVVSMLEERWTAATDDDMPFLRTLKPGMAPSHSLLAGLEQAVWDCACRYWSKEAFDALLLEYANSAGRMDGGGRQRHGDYSYPLDGTHFYDVSGFPISQEYHGYDELPIVPPPGTPLSAPACDSLLSRLRAILNRCQYIKVPHDLGVRGVQGRREMEAYPAHQSLFDSLSAYASYLKTGGAAPDGSTLVYGDDNFQYYGAEPTRYPRWTKVYNYRGATRPNGTEVGPTYDFGITVAKGSGHAFGFSWNVPGRILVHARLSWCNHVDNDSGATFTSVFDGFGTGLAMGWNTVGTVTPGTIMEWPPASAFDPPTGHTVGQCVNTADVGGIGVCDTVLMGFEIDYLLFQPTFTHQ